MFETQDVEEVYQIVNANKIKRQMKRKKDSEYKTHKKEWL